MSELNEAQMLGLAYHMEALHKLGYRVEVVVNAARCWWQVKATTCGALGGRCEWPLTCEERGTCAYRAPSAGQTLPAETPVQAQLGTGSGAGAQSDSGADSGHATSAVPCLHPSVSEAATRRLLPHAGTDDQLATDLESLRQAHWTHWSSMENSTVATAVRVLRELGVWRDSMLAALATVEGKEKTR